MGSQLCILEEPQQYVEENWPINPNPILDFAQSHVSALAIDENGQDEMGDLLLVQCA
jgi:hypothetical protein